LFLPLPDIPWPQIAPVLAKAEDMLARLDERLAKSTIREGWIARAHFLDACDALWISGALVHLEDLVLHNERMDVRAPTHEVTRAHTILRARRRIQENAADWPLTSGGLAALRGQASNESPPQSAARRAEEKEDDIPELELLDDETFDLAEEFAALDAAMARSRATTFVNPRETIIYDEDWDEAERLTRWRRGLDALQELPPTLAAAFALAQWDAIDPLQHERWLGPLLASALLRARGKTRAHLACLNTGLRALRREDRMTHHPARKLTAMMEAIVAAAEKGLADHDRWLLARKSLERKLSGRRSHSHLPALIDLVLSRPLITSAMAAKYLDVTPRAAQDLIAELNLRETTGKRRYRAWGVL
jgi:hypothetical protein